VQLLSVGLHGFMEYYVKQAKKAEKLKNSTVALAGFVQAAILNLDISSIQSSADAPVLVFVKRFSSATETLTWTQPIKPPPSTTGMAWRIRS